MLRNNKHAAACKKSFYLCSQLLLKLYDYEENISLIIAHAGGIPDFSKRSQRIYLYRTKVKALS